MTSSYRTTVAPLAPALDLAAALNDTQAQLFANALAAAAPSSTQLKAAPVVTNFAPIYGTPGADNIHGTSGADLIFAGAGDDIIEAGDGNDTIYAGDGNDYVNSFSAGDDEFFGGNGDDFYYGYTGNERIHGDAGNDTLKGYSGNDVIEGGQGADDMDGGNGWDEASYANASSGVSASLLSGTGWKGDAYGDKLTGFEALTGSAYADTLLGNNDGNVLDGGAGNDYLFGAGGWDNIYGGVGDDTIDGGTGDDYLSGGDGNDTFKAKLDHDFIDGGSGIDTLDYSGIAGAGPNNYWGVQVHMGKGETWHNSVGGQGETFTGIENVIGSSHADFIEGDDHGNVITGGLGNDEMYGKGGNDTFIMGNDSSNGIDGGEGIDTVDWSAATGSVIFTINGSFSKNGGVAWNTSSYGIENVIGGTTGDNIKGSSANNVINGMGGDDWLTGNGGSDTLTGGVGTDLFFYNDVSESDDVWYLRDRITDFKHGEDELVVSAIDARDNVSGNQSFNYIGDSAFTATGQIRSYYENGHTLVEFNTSDAAGAEMVIELDGYVALDSYDFVL